MGHPTEVMANAARSLSSQVDAILPPVQVLRECSALAETQKDIREVGIGYTESGHPLKAYEFGHGQTHLLLYGFPDPGEAVGGTTILSLLRGLADGNNLLLSLDVTWHFIPCLNFDDQPDGGRTLSAVFRNPDIREVDWCVSNPRAETKALLDYAESVSPAFTFPLHDEYHSGESIPLYIIVSECLDSAVCERVRICLQAFGFRLKTEHPHKMMGSAFDLASELAGEEHANSTFSRLADYGLLAVCEVSQQKGLAASSLVAAQISVGLILIDATLNKQKGHTNTRSH